MSISSIEKEACRAVGIKAKGLTTQSYLRKVASGVDDIDDDAWEELSEETQEWFNEAVRAIKKKKPIPPFVEEEDEEEEEEDEPRKKRGKSSRSSRRPKDEEEEEEEEDEPRKKRGKSSRRPKDDEEEDDEDDEEEKPRRKRGKRKPGVVKAIRLILYKDPDTPAEEVIERVEQQGFSCSRATVETMIYEARQAIATFKELGMYKSPRKK